MWQKFIVNGDSIKRKTERGVLIAFPGGTEHAGFQFWYPKKLIRPSRYAGTFIASIPDDMEISARIFDESSYQTKETRGLTPDDVVDAFGYDPGLEPVTR